jgi:alkylation response protein AidB-like acyl-CoA dehydrogenase
MLDTSRRTAFTPEHDMFRDQVAASSRPSWSRTWSAGSRKGIADRDMWTKCGAQGLLCPTVPEAYGGLGLDFGYNAVIDEELAYIGSSAGITLHSDIVADYIVATAARSRSSTGCRA